MPSMNTTIMNIIAEATYFAPKYNKEYNKMYDAAMEEYLRDQELKKQAAEDEAEFDNGMYHLYELSRFDKDFFFMLVNEAKSPKSAMNNAWWLYTMYNYYTRIYDTTELYQNDANNKEVNNDEDLSDFIESYFDEDFFRIRSDDEEAHFYRAKKSKRSIRRKSMKKDKAKHGLPKHYSKWCKGKVYFAGDKYSYEEDNWVEIEMSAI